MAHSTLPVLAHPAFPQVLSQAIAQEVTRVAQPHLALSVCCYESPETVWGACDGGYPCGKLAVVIDVSTGFGYCAEHDREVRRGF